MRRLGGIVILVTALVGCTTADKSEEDDGSSAHGAAYRADAMHTRTPMPQRSPNKFRFFFKDCAEIGEENYYSKTAYSCSGP